MSHEITLGRGITFALTWESELPPQIWPGYRGAAGILDVTVEPMHARIEARTDVRVDAAVLEDFDTGLTELLGDRTTGGSVMLEPTQGLNGSETGE